MGGRAGGVRVGVESFASGSLRVIAALVRNVGLRAISVIICVCRALDADTILVSVLLAIVHD